MFDNIYLGNELRSSLAANSERHPSTWSRALPHTMLRSSLAANSERHIGRAVALAYYLWLRSSLAPSGQRRWHRRRP